MKHSRRTFFKQGLAGALLLGTSTIARAALPDPVKPKAPKAVNPFHLGMAGIFGNQRTLIHFSSDPIDRIYRYKKHIEQIPR